MKNRACTLSIYFLFCLTALFLQSNIMAQVTGLVKDDKGAGVPFTTVALLDGASHKALGVGATDSTGRFTLPVGKAGNYLVEISALGFQQYRSAPFELSPGNQKDLGTIILQLQEKKLDEVSVLSMRPTIIQKADRLVVNVEGTAMAAGNTAFAVLARSPGVFIDAEGNIQLNGRGGVTVMIDNKLTYLSARDLRTFLEGMSAENVKNIEIITNPSARYDAEGTSGILNINLRKNTQRGMNGSIYAGGTYNFYQQYSYTYGGNLNFKGGKWNSYINMDGSHRTGGRNATFTRVFYAPGSTTYFDQKATGNFKVDAPPSVRLGTDYSINTKHSIGFMGYFAYNKGEDEFLTETLIGNAPKTYQRFIDADNFNAGSFRNFTTNLHYTGKLDTLGKLLTADIDYVNIRNNRESNLYNYFTDITNGTKTQDILYTKVPAGYNIYSAKLDFTQPLKKDHKLEMGVKGSYVESDNDSRFFFNNGSLVPDANRTNYFNYKERITAAYMNWSGTVNKKLSAQAGIRAEYTDGTGESYTTGQVNRRNYLDFFPSIFLQQKVTENYAINYSYSRRITRPNYGNLNPFRAYRDPYTWYEGNTALRPQYTHAFSIAQTFKKIYILTLSYNLNKDVMAEVPILDVANATTIYTTGNVDDGHSVSLTGLAPVRIMRKWETQNTVLLNYSKFSMMSNQGEVVNDQLFFMVQSNHTILLPRSFRAEVNLLYRGPAASGLYRMAAMNRVDVALRKSFLNKKLDVSINANDIFAGFRYLWTTNIGGNVNEFDQYFRWRSVGLTLRYNFSKGQKVDTKRRNTNLEELNRT